MKRLMMIIGLITLSSACLSEREYTNGEYGTELVEYNTNFNYGFSSNSSDRFVDIIGSSLSGDIGEVKNIVDAPTSIEGHDEGDFTLVHLTMTGVRGSAMVMFEIFGGIDSPDLAVGHVYQFLPSRVDREKDDLHIEAIVCSGALPVEWTYDDIVNTVQMEVRELATPEDEPPAKRIVFTTTTESDIATGHIDVVAVDI